MAHTDETETFDYVSAIMDFEEGDLDAVDTVDLFGHLVASGMAWRLQGTYGRTAQELIKAGYISEDGTVLKYVEE